MSTSEFNRNFKNSSRSSILTAKIGSDSPCEHKKQYQFWVDYWLPKKQIFIHFFFSFSYFNNTLWIIVSFSLLSWNFSNSNISNIILRDSIFHCDSKTLYICVCTDISRSINNIVYTQVEIWVSNLFNFQFNELLSFNYGNIEQFFYAKIQQRRERERGGRGKRKENNFTIKQALIPLHPSDWKHKYFVCIYFRSCIHTECVFFLFSVENHHRLPGGKWPALQSRSIWTVEGTRWWYWWQNWRAACKRFDKYS